MTGTPGCWLRLIWATSRMRAVTGTTSEPGTKRCAECKEIKPLTEFHRRSVSKDGRNSTCKACTCLRVRRWQGANPDKCRRRNLLRAGAVIPEGAHLVAPLNHQCDICGAVEAGRGRDWILDHDHAT